MSWQDNVQQEKDQLDARIGRLSAFFNTESFDVLTSVQRNLLVEQYCTMTRYSTVLGLRLRMAFIVPSAPAAGGE